MLKELVASLTQQLAEAQRQDPGGAQLSMTVLFN